MALEGTLRDFSLADIFQLIGLQRKTGVLTLRSPEDVVSISFLEGRVVGADSLNKRLEDRLGQVLLKTGAISPDELEKALKVQMETLERLGHILIRHDEISRDGLRHAIEQQILQIIYRVFRWQDGDYHFSQETSIDYDHELVTPLGAESILMEGARMLDEWPIIEKRIPHRGIVFVPAPAARSVEVTADEELVELGEFEFDLEDPPAPAPVAGRVRVSAMEREVLDLLDGRSSVDDVIKKSPASEFETCKALYALLSRALIREASREELAEARLRAEAPATLAPSQATRLPWLAIALVPLLVFSQLLVPRNPLNALLGPGPKIMPRIQTAFSWARMWGTWQTLQARAALTGTYPDSLPELAREGYLGSAALHDPWGTSYRYVLREQSVLMAGSTPSGAPDPNLLLSVHVSAEQEDASDGRGAILVEP